jgi:hypothetical protein
MTTVGAQAHMHVGSLEAADDTPTRGAQTYVQVGSLEPFWAAVDMTTHTGGGQTHARWFNSYAILVLQVVRVRE